jgi:hypothetical protein
MDPMTGVVNPVRDERFRAANRILKYLSQERLAPRWRLRNAATLARLPVS